MRDPFDRLCAAEDRTGHSAVYLASERSKQLSTDHRKVAYAATWVARGLAAYVRSADAAALPWRHVESGRRAALAAGEERSVLWGAAVQLQRQVQAKRETYRVAAGVRPRFPSTQGPRA
jgi:hypothetical protein